MTPGAAYAPKSAICADKQRLTDKLLEATRAVVTLHNREIAQLIDGKSSLDRLDLALKLARTRRDEAKLALLLHTRSHGC